MVAVGEKHSKAVFADDFFNTSFLCLVPQATHLKILFAIFFSVLRLFAADVWLLVTRTTCGIRLGSRKRLKRSGKMHNCRVFPCSSLTCISQNFSSGGPCSGSGHLRPSGDPCEVRNVPPARVARNTRRRPKMRPEYVDLTT